MSSATVRRIRRIWAQVIRIKNEVRVNVSVCIYIHCMYSRFTYVRVCIKACVYVCMRRNACSSSCNVVSKLGWTKSKLNIFVTFFSIQFYKNPSAASRIVTFRNDGLTLGTGAPHIREQGWSRDLVTAQSRHSLLYWSTQALRITQLICSYLRRSCLRTISSSGMDFLCCILTKTSSNLFPRLSLR